MRVLLLKQVSLILGTGFIFLSTPAWSAPQDIFVTCLETNYSGEVVKKGLTLDLKFEISRSASLTRLRSDDIFSFNVDVKKETQTIMKLKTYQGDDGRADLNIGGDVMIAIIHDGGSFTLVSFKQHLNPSIGETLKLNALFRGRAGNIDDQIPFSCTLKIGY